MARPLRRARGQRRRGRVRRSDARAADAYPRHGDRAAQRQVCPLPFPRTHRYTTSSAQSRSDALLHPLTVPSTSASAARFGPRRVAPAVRPRGLWTMWKYTRDDARAAGKRNGTRAARNSEMSPSCPPTCEVVYISGHAGYEDSLTTKALTLRSYTLRRSRRRHTHTFVELCEEQDEDQAVLPSIMHVRPREAPQASERALAGAHVQIKG